MVLLIRLCQECADERRKQGGLRGPWDHPVWPADECQDCDKPTFGVFEAPNVTEAHRAAPYARRAQA